MNVKRFHQLTLFSFVLIWAMMFGFSACQTQSSQQDGASQALVEEITQLDSVNQVLESSIEEIHQESESLRKLIDDLDIEN